MIDIAVIGTGMMGRNHLRVLKMDPRVTIQAVCDSNSDRVAQVSEQYQTAAYTDYIAMLDDISLDAVVIATPAATHYDIFKYAVSAGLDVLVEKPLCTDERDGQAMVDLEVQYNERVMMVGHILRFDPAVIELRRHLVDLDGGCVRQIICRREGPFHKRIRDVGTILDLAIHDVDVMCYLLNSVPSRAYAEAIRYAQTGYEDLAVCLLRFPIGCANGGVVGSIHANWLNPVKIRSIQVLCDEKLWQVDLLTHQLVEYVNGEVRHSYCIEGVEPLIAEDDAFVTASSNGISSPVPIFQGYTALRWSLYLEESSRTGIPAE